MPGLVVEVVEPPDVRADVRGADGVHERVALAPPLVEERERGLDLPGVDQVALEPDGVLGAEHEELGLGLAQVGGSPGEGPPAGSLRGRAARRWPARHRVNLPRSPRLVPQP